MPTNRKDHFELFHDYDLHIPTRTINLGTTYDDEGDSDGVNHAMATNFLKNMHMLESINKDPIYIYLNTLGGSCVEGMAIYDTIRASKCEVVIKVFGQASSMGSVILQAASERVLAPNACLMFHGGSAGVGSYNPYEVANSAGFDVKYMERIYKILFERINEKREADSLAKMSWGYFEKMNLKGRYLFAEEAVEIGLADRIG